MDSAILLFIELVHDALDVILTPKYSYILLLSVEFDCLNGNLSFNINDTARTLVGKIDLSYFSNKTPFLCIKICLFKICS